MLLKQLLPFLLFCSILFPGAAQNNSVLSTLERNGITEELIYAVMEPASDYAFKVKIITVDDGDTIVELASYNPLDPKGKRWRFISRNGKPPTESQINRFYKNKNEQVAEEEDSDTEQGVENDPQSFKIIKNSSEELIFSFRFLCESLSDETQFQKYLVNEMVYDKITSRIKSWTMVNDESFKMQGIKFTKMETTGVYDFDEIHNTYLLKSRRNHSKMRYMFVNLESLVIEEFYEYKKMK